MTALARMVLLGATVLLVGDCSDDGGVVTDVSTRVDGPQLGTPFADSTLGLGNVAALAFGPEGRLFVSDVHGHDGKLWGDIVILEDVDGDDVADTMKVFAENLDQVAGLVFYGNDLYASALGVILRLRDTDGDDRADSIEPLIPLYVFGSHRNNAIRVGPDDRLYFAVGSEFNLEPGDDEYRSTIVQSSLDGTDLIIYVRGLRNAYDVAWNSAGDMFATDNSFDNTDEDPPDELNHIVEGSHYGFPEIGDAMVEQEGTLSPIIGFVPHSAAQGLDFNFGAQYSGYGGYLFVALYKAGKVVAVALTEEGDTYRAEAEDFLVFPEISGPYTQNPEREGHSSYLHRHPLAVRFSPEGDLFIGAFGRIGNDASPVVHGAVYKIPPF